MTRHPESELLERAEEWPLFGELVAKFRARYLASIPRAETEAREHVEVQPPLPPRGEEGGQELAINVRNRVWVASGVELRQAPNSDSPLVTSTAGFGRLPVLAQDGEWYRVLDQGQVGWVRLPGYGEGDEPPLGNEPAAPRPLPGRPPDPAMMRMAREHLQSDVRRARFGGYTVITDHHDAALMRLLDGVAQHLEPVYAKRYDVEPGDKPREAVILYSKERDYRALQNRLERLAGLPAVGLVSRGVVVLFVGDRGREDVASTLVHELTHLLNRRALGPALPPWLDEGLADDLAHSRILGTGRLVPEHLGGVTRVDGRTRVWSGGHAAAIELDRAFASGRALSLRELLGLDWELFVSPEHRLHYPQGAFLVRFLVEEESTRRAALAYLSGIALGESVSPETLLGHLGMTFPELEARFRGWFAERLPDLVATRTPAPPEPS